MRAGVRDKALFVATCVCYVGAFCCLLTFRRAPKSFGGLGRLVGRWVGGPRRLKRLGSESGYAYRAEVPADLVSDAEGKSRLVVFEDGVPLARPHTLHDDVRTKGLGAYSHWNGAVLFSTSDNTDPRTNGRRYTYAEV